MKSKIIGCGGYLPSKIIDNNYLEASINTTDEWIKNRTGIQQRHISSENESVSFMAYKAATEAILDANIDSEKIQLIINCTTTPDNIFPASATRIQNYLGLNLIPTFDLQAVCAGFIYGLHVADNLIKSKQYDTILVTCAERMSKILNWKDRNTAILFGDGAGAIILTGSSNHEESGIIDSKIYSDGSYYDLLYANNGYGVKMNGKEVFKHAVIKMSEAVEAILHKNNIDITQVDYLIPHQANIRIIENIGERLKLPSNKVVTTIDKHANCSAASIPLALAHLKSSGNLKTGHVLLVVGFGAGFSWGAGVLQW